MYRLQLPLALVFTLALSTTSRGYALTPAAPFAPLAGTSDDASYAAGTQAMNDRRWPDAVREFDKVITAKGSKKVDAALYWKAYSLNKLSRHTEALASCDQLRAQFPGSSWNDDCRTLAINGHGSASDSETPFFHVAPSSDAQISRGSDEDLKMLALNSLVNQDPARALPILREILAGNQPMEMKKHAIFVLTQSKSPEAISILNDVIAGKMGPELQRHAIPLMGVFEGQRVNDTLAGVYRTTTDVHVKRAIISAFFISKDAPRMVELARSEKDLELKRSIVSQLALMNDKVATDYMIELLK